MDAKEYLISLGVEKTEAEATAKAVEAANEDELQLMSILLDALALGEKVSKFRERKRDCEPDEKSE